MVKTLAITLALVAFQITAFSQQSNLEDSKRYIKIILDSEITPEAQSEISQAFKQMPGVRTSRMDNSTGIYLGIYTPNENLSDQTFLNWFINRGYEVTCYYDAAYVEGSMIELSKNNCR
ncbi:hypothetical protein [Fluviicola sp.]|uniref:hypothetical protein n=1 Tax=Fluviicola sp. TaxID=1917219 RepID=UPI0031D16A6D